MMLQLCLRSWSLKAGRRRWEGSPEEEEEEERRLVVGVGAVEWGAGRELILGRRWWWWWVVGEPVRRWTTARKVEGWAWTKVVLDPRSMGSSRGESLVAMTPFFFFLFLSLFEEAI